MVNIKTEPASPLLEPLRAYRMHWKRRRYLIRAFRKSRELRRVTHRVDQIKHGSPLIFATVRNEIERLPHFLTYYRTMGVEHFLIVENGSDDGTKELLKSQPDVSLWTTSHSYKASRFGMDWLNALLFRFGAGHWCLTVDADELLVFPRAEKRGLGDLTQWLEKQNIPMMGTVMLDMFPRGPIGDQAYQAGTDPIMTIPYFDSAPYHATRQPLLKNLWLQGGPRERVFFQDALERAPTLNKIPLVKWRKSYAYVNSTHSALPRSLNAAYIDFDEKPVISGALLHTKFLNTAVQKAKQEKHRQEHFGNSAAFERYYDALTANPDLWHDGAMRYEGPSQLEALGLIHSGGFS